MVTVTTETTVLAALIVHIQLLIAVVVIVIAAAGIIADFRHRVSAAFPACLVSFSILEGSAHALISFHCAVGMVATCQPMPSSAVALS